MSSKNSYFGHYENRNCPLCLSNANRPVLELPATPLGDRFMPSAAEAIDLPRFPLTVTRCESCYHSYLPIVTKASDSYANYLFHSGNSPGLEEAYSELAADICRRHRIDNENLVLDIGANDGVWLRCFKDLGLKVVGVEPAPGPAAIASRKGISVINDYFSSKVVSNSEFITDRPRLISLNFMYANVPDPISFLRDVIDLTDESSIISILTGYHFSQLNVGMFDYVYHEHLSYFSCHDFKHIAETLGLVITHCSLVPLKGGSIHIEMQRAKVGRTHSKFFLLMLKHETWIDDPINNLWSTMRSKIDATKERLLDALSAPFHGDHPIVGYGASHSTTTLTFALGIDDHITAIVDDSPTKQRLYAPGTGVQVLSIEELMDSRTTFTTVILAWQHGPRIIERLRRLNVCGKVIVPFPVFRMEASQ